MEKHKYTGLFINSEGHHYQSDVICNGFVQAFILLTADAIRSGRHYQLNSIEDENGHIKYISDILKNNVLFY